MLRLRSLHILLVALACALPLVAAGPLGAQTPQEAFARWAQRRVDPAADAVYRSAREEAFHVVVKLTDQLRAQDRRMQIAATTAGAVVLGFLLFMAMRAVSAYREREALRVRRVVEAARWRAGDRR